MTYWPQSQQKQFISTIILTGGQFFAVGALKRWQRDGATVRAAVHSQLQQALQSMHVPHIQVEGQDNARLQAAILAVETLSA